MPYLVEIMDAINDPLVERIVFMASSQVGKTEILLNIIGYFIDYDPSPILMIEPTVEMAQDISKDRIAPMFRDTEALRGKVADAKSRDSGSTILHKTFPGGHLTLVGANSAAGLASRPIRLVLADEVDRYPPSAGQEGDPLSLAAKRTARFWNRKLVITSTPTDEDASRIQALFEQGTEERFHVPCPSCDEFQPFEWAHLDFDSLCMTCCHCGVMHSEWEWKAKEQEGRWIAEHPERLADNKTRSFRIFEMYSLFGEWASMKREFLEAKAGGPDTLKTFVNTGLGETWRSGGENQLEDEVFENRRIYYGCEVPSGVQCLTAGVDVQDTRLELEIVGWGAGKRSWGIQYVQLIGKPSSPEVWEQLDDLLAKAWTTADGRMLRVGCACIDSGGHYTQEVYDYCRRREHLRIFAIKGVGGAGHPIVGKYSRVGRHKCALFPVGADAGKANIHASIAVEHEDQGGYCLWPREENLSDGTTPRGYDEEYFRGLLSERMVLKMRSGRPVHAWEVRPGRRNEPLDCRNYAQAALVILNPRLEETRPEGERRRGGEGAKAASKAKRRRVLSKGVQV